MQFLEPTCPLIDVIDVSHNESNVVHDLDSPRLCTFSELMDGKIIAARRQVNVILVRLPLHAHAENRTVKVNGSSNIANIQSNMSQPQRFH
jgi:hypothetical protein